MFGSFFCVIAYAPLREPRRDPFFFLAGLPADRHRRSDLFQCSLSIPPPPPPRMPAANPETYPLPFFTSLSSLVPVFSAPVYSVSSVFCRTISANPFIPDSPPASARFFSSSGQSYIFMHGTPPLPAPPGPHCPFTFTFCFPMLWPRLKKSWTPCL